MAKWYEGMRPLNLVPSYRIETYSLTGKHSFHSSGHIIAQRFRVYSIG